MSTWSLGLLGAACLWIAAEAAHKNYFIDGHKSPLRFGRYHGWSVEAKRGSDR